MKTQYKLLIVTLLLTSMSAFSLDYVAFKGGKFAKVSADTLESTCGQNFVFRSKYKDQAPVYLTKSLIQAAFQGKIITGLSNVSKELKGNPGKCTWIDSSEFSKL